MEPFIGQVMMFAGNFAPRGWAMCDGQLLDIASHSALFSILGTIYGGDGRTTFGLPDMRGRAAIHPGTGPGLNPVTLGQHGGAESVTLQAANIPQHSFSIAIPCNSEQAGSDDPSGSVPALSSEETYASTASTGETMKPFQTASYGGGMPFSVESPYRAMNHIIATEGTYPSRS